MVLTGRALLELALARVVLALPLVPRRAHDLPALLVERIQISIGARVIARRAALLLGLPQQPAAAGVQHVQVVVHRLLFFHRRQLSSRAPTLKKNRQRLPVP